MLTHYPLANTEIEYDKATNYICRGEQLFSSLSAMVTTSVMAITMTTLVIRENPQLGPTLPLLIKEQKREDV